MAKSAAASMFERITSMDFNNQFYKNAQSRNNHHADLPKINLTALDTGKEVNRFEAKGFKSVNINSNIGKTVTKPKSTHNTPCTTPNKKVCPPSNTPKKAALGVTMSHEKQRPTTPNYEKRMNLKLHLTPKTGNSNGNNSKFITPKTRDFLSDIDCIYDVKVDDKKDVNNDKVESSTSSGNYTGRARRKLYTTEGSVEDKKDGHDLAINFNFAVNMDRKKNQIKTKEFDQLNCNNKPSDEVDEVPHADKSISGMDTPSSIKVAVRMRPLSETERIEQGDEVKDVLIKDTKVLVPHKRECFEFDYCLNSSNDELFDYATQEVVYRKMGQPLLNHAIQGFNTCLFAYGQSGSGKTYTMMGTKEVPGIIPRFINDLFRRINSTPDIEFIVNISFLEIHNEKIHDLLSDEFDSYTKNLRVREHPQTGPYVEDLTVYTVDTCENAIELLHNGIAKRSTASTVNNEHSSRSHSIFSIILVQNKKFASFNDSSEMSCISKVNLVDLAGSERANYMNNDRLREGSSINKSLLTLSKVITLLAEQNNGAGTNHVHASTSIKSTHIPYRDSVLTYLLKDSLGGNSRTSMIATISPAKMHLDETVSTLRYAAIAQKIINIVHVNEDPKMKIINGLLKQISFLKKEVSKNKSSDSLFGVSDSSLSEPGNACICGEKLQSNMNKLKELIDKQKNVTKSVNKLEAKVEKFQNELKTDSFSFKVDILSDLKNVLHYIEEENFLKDNDHKFESLLNKMQLCCDDDGDDDDDVNDTEPVKGFSSKHSTKDNNNKKSQSQQYNKSKQEKSTTTNKWEDAKKESVYEVVNNKKELKEEKSLSSHTEKKNKPKEEEEEEKLKSAKVDDKLSFSSGKNSWDKSKLSDTGDKESECQENKKVFSWAKKVNASTKDDNDDDDQPKKDSKDKSNHSTVTTTTTNKEKSTGGSAKSNKTNDDDDDSVMKDDGKDVENTEESINEHFVDAEDKLTDEVEHKSSANVGNESGDDAKENRSEEVNKNVDFTNKNNNKKVEEVESTAAANNKKKDDEDEDDTFCTKKSKKGKKGKGKKGR